MFNVESESELELIAKVAARLKADAPIALRINPDVDPQTHKYISTGKSENKFGIDLARAEQCLGRIRELKHLRLRGVHIHIGSQILKNDRHGEAIDRVLPFIERCRKMDFPLEYLNVGGGYGIAYDVGQGVDIAEFARVMLPKIKQSGLKMLSEPGRFISGNGGVMLTQVVHVKKSAEKDFLIVDAAMNDLIRPTIYQAFHKIWPARHPGLANGGVMGADSPLTDANLGKNAQVYDVVGPVCESGDYFALGRKLPRMEQGELVAVFSAGAYGATMASNYNTRGRAAEVIVNGSEYWVARDRETVEDMIRGERLTPREVFKA
jgi:diaminopimelate decarboxylase